MFIGVLGSGTDFWFAALIALLPFLSYATFFWFILSKKERKKLSRLGYKWNKGAFGVEVDKEFELMKCEKIILPMTEAYVIGKSVASYSEYPREVIVTNMRILIGLYANLLFYRRVTFGEFNFWHKDAKNIPSTAANLLGANEKIKNIEYGRDKERGGYVKLVPGKFSAIGYSFKIYHPQAKKVFDIFSKPMR